MLHFLTIATEKAITLTTSLLAVMMEEYVTQTIKSLLLYEVAQLCLCVDEVVSRQEMRNGSELWAVSLRVVVELEERHSEKLHVLGHREDL